MWFNTRGFMSKAKILVVDDDYSSRLFLQKILEKENYPISQCSDGLEALEILEKQQFDLVITDLKMESVDGLELLEKIKHTDPEIAVIILTGHASTKTAIEALRLGASDYLIKPINIEELRIRVKKALERQDLEKRLKEAERRITYNATITTANHEINQPLTVILSGSDMIRMEFDRLGIQGAKVNNYLKLIQKSASRIADILKKFREISSPVILKIPHGMRMIELDIDQAVNETDAHYILVIESEENLRQILKDALESANYNVITAATAKEGLGIFRTNYKMIEVVLIDFNTPDANGHDSFERLLHIDPNCKVIITSGYEFDDNIQDALNNGAIGFLGKPYTREQILSLIEQVYKYHPENE